MFDIVCSIILRAATCMYDQASLINVQKHNGIPLFTDFGETGSDLIRNIFIILT